VEHFTADPKIQHQPPSPHLTKLPTSKKAFPAVEKHNYSSQPKILTFTERKKDGENDVEL